MRRRAGWLPGNQEDLEAWLAGQLEQLSAEEREVLRAAAVIMDKLASG